MHHPLLFTVVVLAIFLAALGYNLVCAWAGTASRSERSADDRPTTTDAGGTEHRQREVPVALGGRVGAQ